jgi:3-oxoacyl-[acyl-carrier protein] reductase
MNGHLSPEERQMLEDEIPAGRMATPYEAADFIVHIAECGEYLNGQVITFDGAWQ